MEAVSEGLEMRKEEEEETGGLGGSEGEEQD